MKTAKLGGYQRCISEATGVTAPADLDEIEDVMRGRTGGCLDHLHRDEFDDLARLCWEVVKYLREEE